MSRVVPRIPGIVAIFRCLAGAAFAGLLLLCVGCAPPQPENNETAAREDPLDLFGYQYSIAPDVTSVASPEQWQIPTLKIVHPNLLDLGRSGEVVVGGSLSYSGLVGRFAAGYTRDGYGGRVTINQASTGRSFDHFCRDDGVDLLIVVRPPAPEESLTCSDRGRSLVAFKLGTDRIALAVNSENYWLDELRSEDLAILLAANTWDALDPSFPSRPVLKRLPLASRDIWQPISGYMPAVPSDPAEDDAANLDQTALANADQPALDQTALVNAEFFDFDNELFRAVEANRDAMAMISMSSYASLDGSGSDARVVPLDALDPLVAMEYPLEQQIFLVLDKESLTDREEVVAFSAWTLNQAHVEMVQAGLWPLRSEAADVERREFVAVATSAAVKHELEPLVTIEGQP